MNSLKTTRNILVAGAALLALAACSNAKEQLGLTHSAPDAFAVVKRAPLEMPPDYQLRPPSPGAARPQEIMPEHEARSVVFGAQAGANKPGTATTESFILQQTGASQTDPSIRNTIDAETAKLEPAEKPVAERLIGWSTGGSSEPAASVVDPKAENERLKKNAEEGKPVTAGETPSKEE